MTEFPTTPDELDAARLTSYLRASGEMGDASVADLSYEIIGTGKMGDNARFRLTYDAEDAAGPATIVAKFPAADATAREMAGAGGAYFNEVMFYREFAPRTDMRTPCIYASELSDDRTSFLLLMEDLAPAEPGSQLRGESRAHTELALTEAIKLATAFYDDPIVGAAEHVMTPARDDGGAFGQALLEAAWPNFVERFSHHLTDESRAFGDRYMPHHAHYVCRYDRPRTLAHGDFRSENILFGDVTATIVDWQTPTEASPLTDIAYFLGGSVEVEDRRVWERDLVAECADALGAEGVVVGASASWDTYREAAMHGIMITVLGATYSTPTPRSDEMFGTMIRRHLQHCLDLDAGDFLPA